MNKIIKTKYGNASITNRGYYVITSGKNASKLLHRLVFEDYHNCKLDSNDVIHHIDFNPQNNHPTNLICMSKKAHLILHHKNKILSEKTKQKMNKYNNSGFYHVSRIKPKNYKHRPSWRYYYYDENGKIKTISNISIKKLEKEVKSRGLKWYKFKKND